MDVQRVLGQVRAPGTQRPAPDPVVERILDVLGNESRDVHVTLGPLAGPPAAFLDRVLERGHTGRGGQTARREIGEDPGPGIR